MLEWDDVRMVIDAGPDFRCQMLRAGIRHIDAILLTHAHRDHMSGLDDVRALNYVDWPEAVHRIDLYATHPAIEAVRREFEYAFRGDKYRGVPELDLHEIDPEFAFEVKGKEVTPVIGKHAPGFDVTGFRFDNLAYLTDFKEIDPSEEAKLRGLKVLVVNALGRNLHHSHFNLDEALALIERVGPERAYLTHVSHKLGRYTDVSKELPKDVYLAYDGLEIEI